MAVVMVDTVPWASFPPGAMLCSPVGGGGSKGKQMNGSLVCLYYCTIQ